MFRFLSNLIAMQEKRAFHGENVVFFALFVGGMRFFLEVFLTGFDGIPLMSELLLNVSWYFMCFFLFGLPVRLLAPPPWEARINVMLVGLFLGFLPPIIDVLISGWGQVVIGHEGFAYAYVKDFPEGWPLLMIDRARRVPPGEGIVLWLAVAFTGAYLWLRTRRLARAIAGAAMAYGACVLGGAIIPTFTNELVERFLPGGSVSWVMIYVQLAVTAALYLVVYRPSLAGHVVARFAHAMPLVGLSLVGYAWIRPLDAGVFTAVLAIAASGVMTIVQNDHWDDHEERPDEPARVRRHDVIIVQFLWVMMVLTLFASDSMLGVILMIYGVASYLYNAPLYRGKRYFPANLKLEGLWGGAAFLLGVFAASLPELIEVASQRSHTTRIHPSMSMMPFSWAYGGEVAVAAFLAFGGWSVLAALKDEKDVATDLRVGSQTVFTLLARRGVAQEKVRRVLRGLAFAGLSVAAWAPFLLGRISLGFALALMGLGAVIAALRMRSKATEFRWILILLAAHLALLAVGLSRSHA